MLICIGFERPGGRRENRPQEAAGLSPSPSPSVAAAPRGDEERTIKQFIPALHCFARLAKAKEKEEKEGGGGGGKAGGSISWKSLATKLLRRWLRWGHLITAGLCMLLIGSTVHRCCFLSRARVKHGRDGKGCNQPC